MSETVGKSKEKAAEVSRAILSDITTYSKYAKYLPDMKRRETWEQTMSRNAAMHLKKFPNLKDEIDEAYNGYVKEKKVLPSMRSAQFAGKPIEMSPSRIFNCSFLPMDTVAAFSELMFLLLGGSGVGISVQRHHIDCLPDVVGPKRRQRRHLIGDSIEGWADAVKVLVESYFHSKSTPVFDFRDIRPKGTLLKTSGGRAPGPQPLKDCLHNIRKVFDGAKETRGYGCKLTTLEVHDISCYIADCVLAGGIRRAALISLFSFDDESMLTCKYGKWWELNPQRARANNSAVALRNKIRKKDFYEFWDRIKASGSGEPGIYFSSDKSLGTNPCCEVSLKPCSFCNLTTINASDVTTQEELNKRATMAARIGTLQATYTDFHYLRDVWRTQAEKEPLLGVSMTGLANESFLKLDLAEAAKCVVAENKRVADKIGIAAAQRTTCIKPEGSASLVLGCSSGVHAWHGDYYIRRLRLNKEEPLYQYIKKAVPELIEDDVLKPEVDAVLSVPIRAPKGAILRDEGPLDLLERCKKIHDQWIISGHIDGQNTHNVSVTVSIKDDEWSVVGDWMWNNRNSYNGIAVLPFDGGDYVQAPFEVCTKDRYNELLSKVKNIDLKKVKEEEDNTKIKEELACSGGSCSITRV